jgi:hypothetical protein
MCSSTNHAGAALAWPWIFQPQHLTPPDVVRPHAWPHPQAIAATLVNTTAAGVFLLIRVPSPSCTHQT